MAKTKVHGEYLDPSVISGQTQVTAVGADSVLIFDATDNALKKALLSDVIETIDGGAPTFTTATISGSNPVLNIARTSNYTYKIGSLANDTFAIQSNETSDASYVSLIEIDSYAHQGSSPAIKVDSSGNVGIGGSPGAKLDVNTGTVNTLAHFHSTDDNAFIEIKDDDTQGYIGVQNDYLYIGGAPSTNTQNLIIHQTTGKVGIGTTSPDGPFHVKSSTNKTIIADSTFSSGSFTSLSFQRNGTDKWRIFQVADDSYLGIYNDQTSSTQCAFSASGGTTISNESGGATAANYLRVEGSIANNSNYPAIEVKGGTLANVYPAYGLTNGGLGTWITAGYHTTNYNSRAALSVNNGTVGMYVSSGSSYVHAFNLTSGGNLSITGTLAQGQSLSDSRLKENITVIPDAIDKVKTLQGITFTRKNDGTEGTGLIAEELEKVLPQAVYETTLLEEKDYKTDVLDEEENKTKYKAIRYEITVGLLVQAIKEQQEQIESLQQEIEVLKNG